MGIKYYKMLEIPSNLRYDATIGGRIRDAITQEHGTLTDFARIALTRETLRSQSAKTAQQYLSYVAKGYLLGTISSKPTEPQRKIKRLLDLLGLLPQPVGRELVEIIRTRASEYL